jgi:hypothetical protein
MATRPLTTRKTPVGSNNLVHIASWDTLTTTNADGAPLRMPEAADRSVQVFGTFGTGGNLVIEGSNDGGTTYHTLTDPQGNALAFTSAKIETITELTELVRPRVTAGDGTTDLDVHLLTRRMP